MVTIQLNNLEDEFCYFNKKKEKIVAGASVIIFSLVHKKVSFPLVHEAISLDYLRL